MKCTPIFGQSNKGGAFLYGKQRELRKQRKEESNLVDQNKDSL